MGDALGATSNDPMISCASGWACDPQLATAPQFTVTPDGEPGYFQLHTLHMSPNKYPYGPGRQDASASLHSWRNAAQNEATLATSAVGLMMRIVKVGQDDSDKGGGNAASDDDDDYDDGDTGDEEGHHDYGDGAVTMMMEMI